MASQVRIAIISMVVILSLCGVIIALHLDLTAQEPKITNVDLENEIKSIVEKTKSEYDGNLSSISNLQFGEYYSFVFSGDLDTILVHPKKEVIGTHPTGVNNADISVEEILEALKTSDGVWVKYVYQNPATGNEESKRSWLSMHDGYVFAAGYYNP